MAHNYKSRTTHENNKVFYPSWKNKLEDDLLHTVVEYFTKNGTESKRTIRFSSELENKTQGIDAFIDGLPVDFTYNFVGKSCTTTVGERIELPGVGEVWFGVRTGSSHAEFKTPVLVIGLDSGYFRNAINNITDAVRKRLTDIVEAGSKAYHEYYNNNVMAKGAVI